MHATVYTPVPGGQLAAPCTGSSKERSRCHRLRCQIHRRSLRSTLASLPLPWQRVQGAMAVSLSRARAHVCAMEMRGLQKQLLQVRMYAFLQINFSKYRWFAYL